MLVGYARVSTLDQNHDIQTDALKAAGCERIFAEKISGAVRHLPELERAVAFCRKDDVLCVWKIDRLGRTFRGIVQTMEDLRDKGVHIRSLTQGIDSSTEGGRIVFVVFSIFAEVERINIRERAMAGQAKVRAMGIKVGRKLRLTPEQERQVATLHAAEIPPKEICRQFNIGRRTMWRTIVRVADRDREARRAVEHRAIENVAADLRSNPPRRGEPNGDTRQAG